MIAPEPSCVMTAPAARGGRGPGILLLLEAAIEERMMPTTRSQIA